MKFGMPPFNPRPSPRRESEQAKTACEESPNSRMRKKYGVDTEPCENHLQQNLLDGHNQPLGPVQVMQMISCASETLLFCEDFCHPSVTQNRAFAGFTEL